ncbi:MAG TPA: response regulator [Candidatus Nanoarchaeia archaeon]|nr:response regulator [Candidatus Nanoarchaeia archaeon]
MPTKKALIGAHQRMTGIILDVTLSPLGYAVERVGDLPQMLEKCREQDYDLYVMDANLGIPGAPTVEPAQQVHQALYARGHERGLEKRLYTFSGNEATVDLAQAQGLKGYLSPLTVDLIKKMVAGEE